MITPLLYGVCSVAPGCSFIRVPSVKFAVCCALVLVDRLVAEVVNHPLDKPVPAPVLQLYSLAPVNPVTVLLLASPSLCRNTPTLA